MQPWEKRSHLWYALPLLHVVITWTRQIQRGSYTGDEEYYLPVQWIKIGITSFTCVIVFPTVIFSGGKQLYLRFVVSLRRGKHACKEKPWACGPPWIQLFNSRTAVSPTGLALNTSKLVLQRPHSRTRWEKCHPHIIQQCAKDESPTHSFCGTGTFEKGTPPMPCSILIFRSRSWTIIFGHHFPCPPPHPLYPAGHKARKEVQRAREQRMAAELSGSAWGNSRRFPVDLRRDVTNRA